MSVPSNYQRDVELKIQEGLNIAQSHYGREFPFPSISYDLKGKTAGTATYQRNHIRLNAVLLVENGDKFINRTVLHELAHLLTYQVHGVPRDRAGRHAAHGREWKSMMNLLGVESSRCHSYDTSNSVGRKVKQFVWKCDGCGDMFSVGRQKHLKMQTNRYTHKCGGRRRGSIQFIDSPGNYTKQEAIQVVRDGMSFSENQVIQDVKPQSQPKTPPKPRQSRSRGSGKVSNLGQARDYARANPGVSSSDLRNWAESTLGCSAHSARGIWSKLKKEGLVG